MSTQNNLTQKRPWEASELTEALTYLNNNFEKCINTLNTCVKAINETNVNRGAKETEEIQIPISDGDIEMAIKYVDL